MGEPGESRGLDPVRIEAERGRSGNRCTLQLTTESCHQVAVVSAAAAQVDIMNRCRQRPQRQGD